MNVHWTDTALRHLDTIHRHIAQDSPAYAKRMVDEELGPGIETSVKA